MSEKLLSVREAAARTSLSESTWRSWILNRRIPYVKLGRSVRIREADVERLIAAGASARG